MKAAELDDGLVRLGDSPITMSHDGPAMAALLERWPDTQAIMCVSDMSAFGAIMEGHRRGISVPAAVAGFGNFEVFACCTPTITTVSVDAYSRLAHRRDLAGRAASARTRCDTARGQARARDLRRRAEGKRVVGSAARTCYHAFDVIDNSIGGIHRLKSKRERRRPSCGYDRSSWREMPCPSQPPALA